MSFWKSNSANPKRKFRFRISIAATNWDNGSGAGLGGYVWYAKSCTAPSVEVSSVEHMFSDHVFNFPGKAKWGDVEMVLVDPRGDLLETDNAPDTVANFNELLALFGYEIPGSGGKDAGDFKTINKNNITDSVIIIEALNDNGSSLETWTLNNAFPIAFKYGDFDYGSDDLREMTITWKYDWASCVLAEQGPSGATSYFE